MNPKLTKKDEKIIVKQLLRSIKSSKKLRENLYIGIEEVSYIRFNVSKEQFFLMIAKNMYESEGVAIEDISRKICKLFNGLISNTSIMKVLPEEYKNNIMASIRIGKINNSGYTKKLSKSKSAV